MKLLRDCKTGRLIGSICQDMCIFAVAKSDYTVSPPHTHTHTHKKWELNARSAGMCVCADRNNW